MSENPDRSSASGPARPQAAEWLWLVAGLALLIALEFTPTDWVLARAMFDDEQSSFPLRHHWFLTLVSHDGLKWLSTLVFVGLLVSVRWPLGVLRELPLRARAYLAGSAALGLVLVSVAKRASFTQCPWALDAFGGISPYLPLFAWPPAGAEPGHCFPAGHASAAFAYLGVWFAWRDVDRRRARIWLALVLAFGVWTGLAQQLRGAHFLTHTLATAWLCYAVALLAAWWASTGVVKPDARSEGDADPRKRDPGVAPPPAHQRGR